MDKNQYPNIKIVSGVDKKGDLYNEKNLKYIIENHSNSMDIVTADGGFDFSTDFNKQELSIANLLFAQICYAVTLQKKNGSFILKIFDVFKYISVELLFLLSNCYENVYIYKPFTSRIANSEKYIICKI